ncbi:hypothetical protein HYQ45_018428 [Verticillium longisporum]|uniref:Uncharacterized protein n=1 Tax=Verticillium longisporum TaxID=100787 RepID=A0A0G4KNQ9_VERLO|nr:DNA-binding protein creA [Verticillium dahliae VDG2]KAG7106304.1 hypothetical protein HYQ45_018428 [Verticillium longisporum]KAG7122052.1 hypothetical protein HYQ44_002950 [Verticillium longisporum]KAG7152797.1 hypothetical protein HYQ46_005504 [Verticillium longisporum]CRK11306.1 hypothetical protein BN1708_010112 [Verticillium longisporum]
MPIFGHKDPTDKRGLYEKIRGPSKEEVEKAVSEHFGLKEARYVETRDSSQEEAVKTPCVVFLIIGKFEVGGNSCDLAYVGYTVIDETEIKLAHHSAVVIMPLS